METTTQVIPDKPLDRVARFNGFLADRRWNRTRLAEILGVSPSLITHLVNSEVCSRRRLPYLEKLDAMGIPRDLLPQPEGGWPESVSGIDHTSSHPCDVVHAD